MSPPMEDQIKDDSPANAEDLTTTRRDLLHGTMLLSAAVISAPLVTACAQAAESAPTENKQMDKQSEKSLYDRLGGIFAIAAVVNHFSDEIIGSDRRRAVEQPGASQVAYETARSTAGFEVHAHIVGCQCIGRFLPIYPSATGKHESRA